MTVMFWEYYGKMLKYRIVLAVVLASVAVIVGRLVLQELVVPNFGMTVKQWLYTYYLLVAASIAAGAVVAACWLKYGLGYCNTLAHKYLLAFACGAAVILVVNTVLAAVLLPPVLEGGLISICFVTLSGLLYYYLDAVLFALPPLRGFVPKAKVLLGRMYGNFAAAKLQELRELEQSFFSDYLLLVPPDVAAKGAFKWDALYTVEWSGAQYKALYPLKPLISKYLAVNELAKYVSFESVNNTGYDGLQVVLSIPYADERFAPKLVTKMFTTGKVKIMQKAPVAAIWPDFVLQGLRRWNRYYFYYESAEKTQFHQFYLRPYWPGEASTLREIYIGQEHCEVTRGREYPRIVTCMIDRDEPMNCGFLLTEEPKAVNVGHYQKGTFSIDFGTVNTTVYFASDTETARPWQLGSRVKLLWKGDNAQVKLRQNFISPLASRELEAWILSSFHIYNENLQKQEDDLFKDGNVFYVHGFDDLGSLQNVLAELKWQHENTVYRQGFLNQLCAQCMAGAAALGITDISWRYSYPKAFVREEWVRYGEVWQKVIGLLGTLSGPKEELHINCAVDKDFVVPESVALAAYCDKTGIEPLGSGSICMDIGGGSTDIVFWYGKDPDITWQDSLRFAGHHILRDYLLYGHNCLLLKELCGSELLLKQVEELHRLACITARNNTKQQLNAFTIRLDALLKYGADELMGNLAVAGDTSLQLRHFISSVTFGLSGLFFYCGLMFGKLCREGRYRHLHKFHSIYVGGNGSRLLDLAAAGSFGSDTKLYKLLAQIFRDGVQAGAGSERFKDLLDAMDLKIIRIVKSSAPKEEIATGLFCEMAAELGLKFAAADAAEPLQPFDSEADAGADVNEHAVFMEFLENYNELAEKFLQQKLHFRNQTSLVKIEEAAAGHLKAGKPAFIAALYAALNDLSRDADGTWKSWVYFDRREADGGK